MNSPRDTADLGTQSQAPASTLSVRVGRWVFGGRDIPVIAGPCSIESEAHLRETARGVRQAGASLLRGGVYKMRTSPESFQGLGEPAFQFLSQVKRDLEMPLVSEITDPRQLPLMIDVVDMFQVGSRNMYNYELLKELGQARKPVLLKRAFAATVDEWLKAADYVLKGHDQVVLCERGIRTFEPSSRNTLDLNSVAYLKAHAQLPVIVDPSHGTGRPELIAPLAAAAIAAGADGLIVEVHPRPLEAKSDAFQAIDFAQFTALIDRCARVAEACDRRLAR
ncbi:MAG TPA: 3-deoxy-7-phosphoheptulonate synthase [Pseudobdellovibrionaceae bacterium]|nr:3-deoxy-7-phosphoheptulonate synthase [Pseudobdellovibrionaceae bacterium]